jgi:hypothetical protein
VAVVVVAVAVVIMMMVVVVVEEDQVVVVGGRNGRRDVRLAASAVNRAISVQTTTPPTHSRHRALTLHHSKMLPLGKSFTRARPVGLILRQVPRN